MKHVIKAIAVGLLLFVAISNAYAFDLPTTTTFTFKPNPKDLNDLPHEKWFKWGINWDLPSGQCIQEASISYYNIYDWTKENNDVLYTTLINTVRRTGLTGGIDYQGGGNYFAGKGVLIGQWSDPIGGKPRNVNLEYQIDSSYFGMLSDGNFGFGIDPDCHYYNDKIEVRIVTTNKLEGNSPVPEGTTAVLSLLGFGAMALPMRFLRNRFSSSC